MAAKLAGLTGLEAIETDRLIEECFERDTGGKRESRAVERKVAVQLAEVDWKLIICGGSSLLDPASPSQERDPDLPDGRPGDPLEPHRPKRHSAPAGTGSGTPTIFIW